MNRQHYSGRSSFRKLSRGGGGKISLLLTLGGGGMDKEVFFAHLDHARGSGCMVAQESEITFGAFQVNLLCSVIWC